MLEEPFQFRARKTPRGQYFCEVLYKGVVIATGKNTSTNPEAVVTEVMDAIANLNLELIIQPNGKLIDLLPA